MIEAKLQNLFGQTRALIRYSRETEILKGEKFNIFSILQVETKENLTHSNFIAELLNPNGTHLKGSKFLELFLESISIELEAFDTKKCQVKKEFHVGRIDLDKETGGRIDIRISDGNQELLIENKVHAGDRNLQLLRYHNSKAAKSTILYLTLDGREPSDTSRGNLVSGEDFHAISYKSHIYTWLEKCQKEAYNAPILRESIRQYQLLIQKLTGTMAQDEQQKLQALILENLDEAELISKNFDGAKISIAHSFRDDLIEKLKHVLPEGYNVFSGSPAGKSTSQIWIKPVPQLPEGLYFGIESFSVVNKNHHDGNLFIGTFNKGCKKELRKKYSSEFTWFKDCWFDTEIFESFDDTTLDFSQNDFVKKLSKDLSFRNELLQHLSVYTKDYLEKQIPRIMDAWKP